MIPRGFAQSHHQLLDLADFLVLALEQPVVQVDGREGLKKNGRARTARGMHHSGNARLSLDPHRNDVAFIPSSDIGLTDQMAGRFPLQVTFQCISELCAVRS